MKITRIYNITFYEESINTTARTRQIIKMFKTWNIEGKKELKNVIKNMDVQLSGLPYTIKLKEIRLKLN